MHIHSSELRCGAHISVLFLHPLVSKQNESEKFEVYTHNEDGDTQPDRRGADNKKNVRHSSCLELLWCGRDREEVDVDKVADVDPQSTDEDQQQEVGWDEHQLWRRGVSDGGGGGVSCFWLTPHFHCTTRSSLIPRNITCSKENIPSNSN